VHGLIDESNKRKGFLEQEDDNLWEGLKEWFIERFFGLDQCSDFITGHSGGLFGQFSIKEVFAKADFPSTSSLLDRRLHSLSLAPP
jgi:hypothetical protein